MSKISNVNLTNMGDIHYQTYKISQPEQICSNYETVKIKKILPITIHSILKNFIILKLIQIHRFLAVNIKFVINYKLNNNLIKVLDKN